MLSRSTPPSPFEGWRLLRVLLTLGLGLFALALPAATVGAAVIECSGRFPDTDVCPGRLHGGPLAAVAIAVAVVPFVAGLGVAVRSTSDRRGALGLIVAGAVMFAGVVGVEAWATGTVL